jgi:hypothetical protein
MFLQQPNRRQKFQEVANRGKFLRSNAIQCARVRGTMVGRAPDGSLLHNCNQIILKPSRIEGDDAAAQWSDLFQDRMLQIEQNIDDELSMFNQSNLFLDEIVEGDIEQVVCPNCR